LAPTSTVSPSARGLWRQHVFFGPLQSTSLSAAQIEDASSSPVRPRERPLIVNQPAPATDLSWLLAIFTVNAASGHGTPVLPGGRRGLWASARLYQPPRMAETSPGPTSQTLTISNPGQWNQADYVVVITSSYGQVNQFPGDVEPGDLGGVRKPGRGGTVTAVATSPDGAWIASAAMMPPSRYGAPATRAWNARWLQPDFLRSPRWLRACRH